MESVETQLCKNVQHNCDISDARFARDYSMCVYLLRMQEHYRWKNSLALDVGINRDSLGRWVRETEDYWDTIEDTEFKPVVIDGKTHDPLDADGINQSLAGSTLTYTSGIGRLGQPHFVLAKRISQSQHPIKITELGHELARDSITVPAMTRNGSIVIRHDSLKRMLWQMISEWRLRKPEGPMSRLLAHYGIDANQPDLRHIETTANDLSRLLIQHERGEIIATGKIGIDYAQMIVDMQGNPAEGYLRAVGDLLADALSTWPYIIEHRAEAYLDFWLAGLQGIRETLMTPTTLYQQLGVADDRIHCLSCALPHEQHRWQLVAEQLLNAYRKHGQHFDFKTTIQQASDSVKDQ